MTDTVSIPNPYDLLAAPIFEGNLTRAAQVLRPGTYRAHNETRDVWGVVAIKSHHEPATFRVRGLPPPK